MNTDFIPASIAAAVITVVPAVPGPTKDEWSVALVGLFALVIREVIWWARNRTK